MVIPEDMALLSWALKSKVEADVKQMFRQITMQLQLWQDYYKDNEEHRKGLYRTETTEIDRERERDRETHCVEVEPFLIRTGVEMEGDGEARGTEVIRLHLGY